MAFSGNHVARIALLSVAAILCIVSLFLAWWVIDVQFNGSSNDTSARPFDAGQMADDDDDENDNGLSAEVIVTGILTVLATLTVIAYLVLEMLPVIGRAAQPLPRLLMAFFSIALGLAAILYTAFAWPEGMGGDMSFFDKVSFDSGGFFSDGSGSVTTYAGVGWWLALVGAILLPLIVFVIGLVDVRGGRPAG